MGLRWNRDGPPTIAAPSSRVAKASSHLRLWPVARWNWRKAPTDPKIARVLTRLSVRSGGQQVQKDQRAARSTKRRCRWDPVLLVDQLGLIRLTTLHACCRSRYGAGSSRPSTVCRFPPRWCTDEQGIGDHRPAVRRAGSRRLWLAGHVNGVDARRLDCHDGTSLARLVHGA